MSANSKIAIVGFGAAGLSCFIQLIQAAIKNGQSCTIYIYDKNPSARGLAYDTHSPQMRLNFDARLMGVGDGEHESFNEWLARIHSELLSSGVDHYYPPREFFGEYLGYVKDFYMTQAKASGIEVVVIAENAVEVTPSGVDLVAIASDSITHTFGSVILALGNIPSTQFSFLDASLSYSKSVDLPFLVKDQRPVAIIGSRLTAIDVALHLKLVQKIKNQIFLVSRSGALPTVLSLYKKYDLEFATKENLLIAAEACKGQDISPILQLVHKELRSNNASLPEFSKDPMESFRDSLQQVKEGETLAWQMILISIYPFIHELWAKLDKTTKRFVYDKFYSKWITYFNSMPAHTAIKIEELMSKNELKVAGGFSDITYAEDRSEYDIHTASGHIAAGTVIDASGPSHNLEDSPLLAKAQSEGLISKSSIGDVKIDPQSCRVEAETVVRNIYAVGELTLGSWFTVNTLEQINIQAQRIARDLFA